MKKSLSLAPKLKYILYLDVLKPSEPNLSAGFIYARSRFSKFQLRKLYIRQFPKMILHAETIWTRQLQVSASFSQRNPCGNMDTKGLRIAETC